MVHTYICFYLAGDSAQSDVRVRKSKSHARMRYEIKSHRRPVSKDWTTVWVRHDVKVHGGGVMVSEGVGKGQKEQRCRSSSVSD